MNPRTEYEMTQGDLDELIKASQPTVAIMVGKSLPSSPQENANRAWRMLGEEMGFDYETVRPIPGKGQRFFSAVPSETAEQRDERLRKEIRERHIARLHEIEAEIEKLQAELVRLTDKEST